MNSEMPVESSLNLAMSVSFILIFNHVNHSSLINHSFVFACILIQVTTDAAAVAPESARRPSSPRDDGLQGFRQEHRRTMKKVEFNFIENSCKCFLVGRFPSCVGLQQFLDVVI